VETQRNRGYNLCWAHPHNSAKSLISIARAPVPSSCCINNFHHLCITLFYCNTPMLASGIKGMHIQLRFGSGLHGSAFMRRRLGCPVCLQRGAPSQFRSISITEDPILLPSRCSNASSICARGIEMCAGCLFLRINPHFLKAGLILILSLSFSRRGPILSLTH